MTPLKGLAARTLTRAVSGHYNYGWGTRDVGPSAGVDLFMTRGMDRARLAAGAAECWASLPQPPSLTEEASQRHDDALQTLAEALQGLPAAHELTGAQYQLKSGAPELSGANPKVIVTATLADGRRHDCIGKALAGRERLYAADHFVMAVRALLGWPYVPVARVSLDLDGNGPVDYYVKPFLSLTGDRSRDELSSRASRWSDVTRNALLADMVMLQFIAQFDAKRDHYLFPRGPDDQPIAVPINVDCDQAGSDLVRDAVLSRHDEFSWFNSPPAFHPLLRRYISGRDELDWTAAFHAAEAIAGLSDDDVRALSEPLARALLEDPSTAEEVRAHFPTPEAIVEAIVTRKRDIRSSTEHLIRETIRERALGRHPVDWVRDTVSQVRWATLNEPRVARVVTGLVR